MNDKHFFSVFSGEIYTLSEEYTHHLDCGQLEITNLPKKSCKRCYGRGYVSKNHDSGHYDLCKCTLRDASASFLKNAAERQVEDIRLHTKKEDFNNSEFVL